MGNSTRADHAASHSDRTIASTNDSERRPGERFCDYEQRVNSTEGKPPPRRPLSEFRRADRTDPPNEQQLQIASRRTPSHTGTHPLDGAASHAEASERPSMDHGTSSPAGLPNGEGNPTGPSLAAWPCSGLNSRPRSETMGASCRTRGLVISGPSPDDSTGWGGCFLTASDVGSTWRPCQDDYDRLVLDAYEPAIDIADQISIAPTEHFSALSTGGFSARFQADIEAFRDSEALELQRERDAEDGFLIFTECRK